MKQDVKVPTIESVKPMEGKRLLVKFANGVSKVYDCTPILKLPRFHLLCTEAFFRVMRVDNGGYGISWNDEMDLSEHELWQNGTEWHGEDIRDGVSETAR